MDDTRILDQAFLKAKIKFRATGMSGTNTGQKWNYAKLEDIYNAVEDSLAEQGIFIRHLCKYTGDAELLYTYLKHAESGQYVMDERRISSEKPGNQGRGAGETYAKKYAVLSLCAIATSDKDDDDGVEEQHYILVQELKNLVGSNTGLIDKILQFNKKDALEDLSVRQLEQALYHLKNPKKKE